MCSSYWFDAMNLGWSIVSREGINCSIIDLRVLSGNIEEISREGSFELVGALLKYIQCTKRFH